MPKKRLVSAPTSGEVETINNLGKGRDNKKEMRLVRTPTLTQGGLKFNLNVQFSFLGGYRLINDYIPFKKYFTCQSSFPITRAK